MLRPLLSGGILWCLLAGRLPEPWPAVAAAAVFLCGLLLHRLWRHDHSHWSAIDCYAQQSRLSRVPAGLKLLLTLVCIVLVLAAGSPAVSILALGLAFLVTVALGRTPCRTLLQLFAVPLTFVLLSALALLFDVTADAAGPVAIPCFGRYLTVTAQAQAETLRLLLGAAASVSCLYALCLSTPLHGLIAAMGRAHLPSLLIELMYLIYRYIFVLSGTLTQMKTAAAARLGFSGFRPAMRSTGRIMTSLLLVSFRKASASFDAMQSRCYEGRIRFLEERTPWKPLHLLAAAGITGTLILAIALERSWF